MRSQIKGGSNRTRARGRKRRLVAWCLFIFCAASGVLWIASIRWQLYVRVRGIEFSAYSGIFEVSRVNGSRGPALTWAAYQRASMATSWRVSGRSMVTLKDAWIAGWWIGPKYSTGGQDWIVQVVVWPILALTLCGGLLLWRSARMARRLWGQGKCRQCGYALTGLPRALLCPECGAQISLAERTVS